MVVPPWLEPLLSTEFFSPCRVQGHAPRNECNLYCLECNAGAFCLYCRSAWHNDHHVIQIRRSSYHDVVRVAEIQKAVDIAGVQTYVINSARVIFLNERPQPKPSSSSGNKPGGAAGAGSGHTHICELCCRSLLDPVRFCSLGCKLAEMKKNGDPSINLEATDEVAMERRESIISKRVISSRTPGEETTRGAAKQSVYSPPSPQTPPSGTRRRKGIPHRAPFGS